MGCNSSAQKNSKNYRSKAQNGIRDILGGKPKKSWYVDVVLSRFMKHCTVLSRGPGCNKVNNPRQINSLSLLIYKGIKSTVTKSPLLQQCKVVRIGNNTCKLCLLAQNPFLELCSHDLRSYPSAHLTPCSSTLSNILLTQHPSTCRLTLSHLQAHSTHITCV
jgi:hypothetical protein